MRIGVYHGYELSGTGSNEYTRYLSWALAEAGHDVHVMCRDRHPRDIEHVTRAVAWDARGVKQELFARKGKLRFTLHQLPSGPVRPVYLTDQPRPGDARSFVDLTDEELADYHSLCVDSMRAVIDRFPLDVILANHLVWQPCVAAELGVPFFVFPHGSAIEFVVKRDERIRIAAGDALREATGLITGNVEVRNRILALYPEEADAITRKSQVVGVGVDTAKFRPIARADRRANVGHVEGDPRGKSAALRGELRDRLAQGDHEAIIQFRDRYHQGAPDADLAERLAEAPFEAGQVILFVGALTAGKGVQSLIAAMPSVLERFPDALLVVVGGGAYREVLEALVIAIETGDQALYDYICRQGFDLDRSHFEGPFEDVGGAVPTRAGISERVLFTGRLDHERLRYLFPCADVAVFPSVVPEAYPLVMMESLSNGVLPLVSNFSGFKDGLDTLVPDLGRERVDRMRLPMEPSRRVAGIVEGIAGALEEHSDLSRDLRRLAVERFDWRVRAGEMVAAFDRQLADSPSPSPAPSPSPSPSPAY